MLISKRHGPLFRLLLSNVEKYEPKSSPEPTTQISTESTDTFEAKGKI